ncbi:hypothetical protein Phou_048660 [Phytohabitans houttuyneae]|uniref:Uncharacterized protein n=1 Tax=Phytohabitans houttuyneae TaxID=1076126 RepID=A0A6V8KF64_9ACTN|nr:hypothetical protein Phou_048660 [Phytohabitans houttuyneae]
MEDEFQFTRAWLRAEATRLGSPKSPAYQLSRHLNLPPSYLLIHRVTLGSIGVLCQLEAKAPYRSIVETWLPGFAPRSKDRADQGCELPRRPSWCGPLRGAPGKRGAQRSVFLGCVPAASPSAVGKRRDRCLAARAWAGALDPGGG